MADLGSEQSEQNQRSSQSPGSPDNDIDICRVCRCEATNERPLFYPCVCTGSIKYIHQDCLVQWLKYSKKEYCELCKHKFSFAPIYDPNMPKRLPAKDIITGLLKNIIKAIKFWLHSTLVAISWMAIVPLTACRIYRCLFAGSVSSLLTLPLDMLSTDNLLADILQGGFVVLCSLAAFISLVWLREQILSGGGPDWLENAANDVPEQNRPAEVDVDGVGRGGGGGLGEENVADHEAQGNVDNQAQNREDAANGERIEADQQQQAQQAGARIIGGGDDNHWNPIEWDRAAEDLTWDRLLGLDGSLLFLEHVFWVISLNTLFILVFAFCPYHLGHYMLYGLKMQDVIEKSHFEGLLTTIVGYVLLAILLILLFACMTFSSFYRARKVVGLCYIVIKVALLVVFEICVFPLVCGVWLDICSLRLFNVTLVDRLNSFEQAPGTSVFLHWLVGMVYVFYFATFVFLLREVLRPGLLWFLRNLNDPDFNPVQEMIQLPVYRHIRRFLTSVTLFGFSIVLIFYVPIRLIIWFQGCISWPILPLSISPTSETLSSELSIELLWLHAALPALLEQSHLRSWAKNTIRLWALSVSYVLGIRSFVMGDVRTTNRANRNPNQNNNDNQANNNNNNNNNNNEAEHNLIPAQQGVQNPFQFNIGVAHQALLQNNTPFVNEPYVKPTYFKTRVFALIILMCISLLVASILSIVLPVCLGRFILFKLTESTKLNDLYTIITGLYTIWFAIRLSTIAYNWIQMGINQLFYQFTEKFSILTKTAIALIMIFGFLPVLFGLLFQQIVINPISCNHDQTPVISIWQIWALGVLHTKILTALILTGPQWWLRQVVDRICQDGVRNMNLKFMFLELFYPVTACLGLALAIPCVFSRSIVPFFVQDEHILILIERRIYPASLFLCTFIVLFFVQIRQFKRLYERIRNDKYLVGQRLINFERNILSKSNFNNSNTQNQTTGED